MISKLQLDVVTTVRGGAIWWTRTKAKGRHGVVCRLNCVIHVWAPWGRDACHLGRYINPRIFTLSLPKLIKIRGHLTKFWQKQKCTVFFETRCIYNRKLLYLSCGLSFPDEIWFADMDLSFWRERRHPIRNRSGRHLENRYDILSSGALLREIWHATPTLNNRRMADYLCRMYVLPIAQT